MSKFSSKNSANAFNGELASASRNEDKDMIITLLERGADVNDRGGLFDATALSLATEAGHLDIMKL